MGKKDNRKQSKLLGKKEETTRFSPSNLVSLQTPEVLFLGYKTKNINKLWKWDTLEDVKF